MAAQERDPLADLERHRVRLEENVGKLRHALKHWKTWELEYETLKEEIQIKGDPSSEEMLQIGRDLGSNLVNEKEVSELLGRDKRIKRKSAQVVDMISKRVNYVQQNITTVEKQLHTAEKKLNAATVLLEPDLDDEEGLPLTDIQEKLDEDGNVISSTLSNPSKAAPGIVSELQKAGITELGQGSAESSKPVVTEDLSNSSKPTEPTQNGIISEKASGVVLPKKTVSFSEHVEHDPSLDGASKLAESGFNEDLAGFTFKPGEKVIEVDENDNEIASYPVIPTNESPENAALRRDMLRYAFSEVGAVVAEIDLDERGQEHSDMDDEDFEYSDEIEDEDEEEIEDEDEHGRSNRPVLTEDYKREMAELEKKWNARLVENLGPRPEPHPLEEYADDVRRLVVQKEQSESEQATKQDTNDSPLQLESKKTKGVRFAENLNISPAPQPVDSNNLSAPISQSAMSDTVIERSGLSQNTPSAPSKPTKVSRFKAIRATSIQSSPMQPKSFSSASPPTSTFDSSSQVERDQIQTASRPLSNTVVERLPNTSDIQPPDEHGLDPELHRREVEAEYHKARNRVIQQQGGFLPNEEEKADPLMEEVDGKVKKVSRFKAARLKAQSGV